jgi:hypothetical protein
MMTKGDLRYRFSLYAEEAGRCKKSGCYWSLLHLLMSVPDVCSALEVEVRADKDKNIGERYKGWCWKYLATAEFDAEDWWDARNTVLHQGRTAARESRRYAGFIFSPPGGPGHKLVDPASNQLRLDVWSLANEMLVAMERWFDALLEDPKTLASVEQYLPDLVWSDPAAAVTSSPAPSPPSTPT